jgi:hypothetical protein
MDHITPWLGEPGITRQDAMTIVQTMQQGRLTLCGWMKALVLLGAALASAGCQTSKQDVLTPPQVLIAPYDVSTSEVLWGIAPIINESGISSVDDDAISDTLAARVQEVRGLRCLPLNRTLEAMRARGLKAIRSPQEARTLAEALGVDALVVGTLTAYDPYDPPKVGITLALFGRTRSVGVIEARTSDPMELRRAYTDKDNLVVTQFAGRPLSVIAEHLDAQNHAVLSDLQRYAAGRHDPDKSMGWRRYTASMDLYIEFATHQAVARLLQEERLRLAQPANVVGVSTDP